MEMLLSEEIILVLGERLNKEWRKAASSLKFSPREIDDLAKKYKTNGKAAIAMLRSWRDKQPIGDEHKVAILKTALRTAKRQDLISYIQDYEKKILTFI